MSDVISRLNAALEGRYRIERELGEGGMATVYLADDVRHGRKVAVKVLKPDLQAIVGAERFLPEIKTTANLQHPHILPLFDSGEADKFFFYVMPYVGGESLRERLGREKQFSVADAVALARKISDALDYAHELGVMHRDIKPANILLSERGEPLVADFGIALAVAQAGGGRLTETDLAGGALWRADLGAGTVRARRRLFEGSCVTRTGGGPVTNWDVHPDGRSFVFVKNPAAAVDSTDAGPPLLRLAVIVNWFEELRQRVSAAQPAR